MIYSELKSKAAREAKARFPRALVQLGGCTRTVGAGAVLQLLQAAVAKKGLMSPVLVAGCDGACHDAPVVIIEMAEGLTFRLTHVGPADVNEILSFWLAGQAESSSTWKGKPAAWPLTGDESGFWGRQERRVMRDIGYIDPHSVDDYIARGGYSTLNNILNSMSPDQVVDEVVRLELRGRGGAYFPTGIKWHGARATGRLPRYLVVNAEEGEPGIYKDRHIMEGNPFMLLEGLAIAAYAIGADKTYLYVNGEADEAAGRVEDALDLARDLGLAGDNVLGADFNPGHRGEAGRWGLRSRRRERPDEQHRGATERAPHQAAVSRGIGALGPANSDKQRRDFVQPAYAPLLPRRRPLARDQADIPERPGAEARPGRSSHGDHSARHRVRGRGWAAGRLRCDRRGSGRAVGRAFERVNAGRRHRPRRSTPRARSWGQVGSRY